MKVRITADYEFLENLEKDQLVGFVCDIRRTLEVCDVGSYRSSRHEQWFAYPSPTSVEILA